MPPTFHCEQDRLLLSLQQYLRDHAYHNTSLLSFFPLIVSCVQDRFMLALQQYLLDHAYHNTQATDLWAAVGGEERLLPLRHSCTTDNLLIVLG